MARQKQQAADDGTADYLTSAQCANRVSVSTKTWSRWAQEGKAPAGIKFAHSTVRWPRAEFEAWLASRPTIGSAA